MSTTTQQPMAIILTGLVAVTVAACGSSPSAAPKPSPGAHSAHSTIPAGNNGNLMHPVGAISDLSGFKCAADSSGRYSATGVVTNLSKNTRQFILDITVVDKNDTVVGSVRRQFAVAAGHRVSAHSDNFYRSTAHGLRCLPRLVRGGK